MYLKNIYPELSSVYDYKTSIYVKKFKYIATSVFASLGMLHISCLTRMERDFNLPDAAVSIVSFNQLPEISKRSKPRTHCRRQRRNACQGWLRMFIDQPDRHSIVWQLEKGSNPASRLNDSTRAWLLLEDNSWVDTRICPYKQAVTTRQSLTA